MELILSNMGMKLVSRVFTIIAAVIIMFVFYESEIKINSKFI